MCVVGVLGLQGSVEEHIKGIEKANMLPLIVKTKEDLNKIGGLILPGGESTAIGILLNGFDLLNPIKALIEKGLPTWGTCAGMILLAKSIVGQKETYFSVMDITVRRNAYGSQLDSFSTNINIPEVSQNPIATVFIRAPYIEAVGNDTKVLAKIDGNIVAAKQGNMIATSFHPELTNDLSFYQYFRAMTMKNKEIHQYV